MIVWAVLLAAAQEPHDAELSVKRLRLAPGLRAELYAAEPQLVNPVAIWADERGRLYVVETHRIGTSVYDIRNFMSWLEDDLACRTVEDRVAMYRKHLGKDAEKLGVESERIRLLEDRDGDGRADHAQTYAEGFGGMAEGLASGILVRGRDVWFANIPNLWHLRDADGDGRADDRRVLHTGYGVHLNYIGHDLHGLTFGPDGKLYFSIGDRGLNVEAGGKRIFNPDSGAVLRCNPDGSELELYATGLRNPQELAFDQLGNLWTWDNNSDLHDMARWVYVVEGLDAGWRIGYQFLPNRGPWEEEKVWQAGVDVPYRLPPVANLDHGPAGIAFYPGTGLPARYDNHFLLCNFPGGINAWAVRPKGASFEVVDTSEFVWNVWSPDLAFGSDGAVYVADWGEGWSKKGVGRVYRVFDPALAGGPAAREVRRLLAEGMAARAERELCDLLGHRDQRVRQAAQFELAARGRAAALEEVVGQSDRLLARLHALWGLGQIASRAALDGVARHLGNPDSEVRAQAARVLGERRYAAEALAPLTEDPVPRVRFFAAMALGRTRARGAVDRVVDLLRRNNNQDAYLRHAAVMALASIGDLAALVRAGRDESPAVRLGALLALRRLERPEVQAFLSDPEPGIVTEAVRAIHDVPIEAAMPALAALLENPGCPDALLPRVINASLRVGTDRAAGALSWFARRIDFPAAMRAEALRALACWDAPPPRDRVLGVWRPYAVKEPQAARQWLRPVIDGLLKDPSPAVQLEAIRIEAAVRWEEGAPALADLVRSRTTAPETRAEALRALAAFGAATLAPVVSAAMEDPDPALRRQAVALAGRAKLPDAVARLASIARGDAALPLRQAAVRALAELEADVALGELLRSSPPASLLLDLEEAAAQRSLPFAPTGTALLEGGDPRAGRAVFLRPDAGCVKCHKVKTGGGAVGPDLTTVGSRLSREKLAEAVLNPNAEIAKGFDALLVQLRSGDVRAGRVERETDTELVLVDAEGRLEAIRKEDIQARKAGKSAMPEDYEKKLPRRDLRDLVAYLAALRGGDPGPLEAGAVVVDDEDVERFRTEGNWRTDRTGADFGRLAHWAFPDPRGRSKATWTASLAEAGRYAVFVWCGSDPLEEHASDAPFTVHAEGGPQTVRVDLTRGPGWKPLGTFSFGTEARVTLSNDANRAVYADALKLVTK
jgi:quinoprotein glucose dehydrogenase